MRNICLEVSVTGTGIVTCLGDSLATTLSAIDSGCRVRGETLPSLTGTPYAAYPAVPDVNPDIGARITDRRMRKFMSRHSELAAVAARQALAESAPLARGIQPERIGLYAGVGLVAVDTRTSIDLLRKSLDEEGAFSQRVFADKGLHAIHPLWSFHTLANMPACIVSVLEKIKGDNGIYTPWEDQTAFALLEAAHALRRGDIDCAVVVAADTPSHPSSLAELANAGYIDPTETAAPGAACLVLERPEGAGAGQPPFPRLTNIRLALDNAPRADPLAPLIGRTVAAAPLLLVALA